MYKSLLISLLCLSFSAFFNKVTAEELEDAVAAMRSGDFAEAYCIMRPLADAGDADSQYNIGWMYFNGYGLRVNDGLALQWWLKASEQGHSDASFSIGMLYSLGDGNIRKNNDKAIDFYLLAAEDGQEDAIAILKSMMLRNDRAIRDRVYSILKNNGSLFGIKKIVKAKKLNVRNEPSTEGGIVGQLRKGESVLEMETQANWSRVAILSEPANSQIAWVYKPLLQEVAVIEDN